MQKCECQKKKISKDIPEKSRGTASKAQAGILQINANSWIIVQAMIYLKLGYLMIIQGDTDQHKKTMCKLKTNQYL